MAALVVLEQTRGQHLTTVDLLEMAAEMVALVDLAVRAREAAVLAVISEMAEKLVTLFKLAARTQEAVPQVAAFHSTM